MGTACRGVLVHVSSVFVVCDPPTLCAHVSSDDRWCSVIQGVAVVARIGFKYALPGFHPARRSLRR